MYTFLHPLSVSLSAISTYLQRGVVLPARRLLCIFIGYHARLRLVPVRRLGGSGVRVLGVVCCVCFMFRIAINYLSDYDMI